MSDKRMSWPEWLRRHKRTQEAATESGERCWRCGQWIVPLRAMGHRRRCSDCKSADEPGEFVHASYVRCPRCRHSWSPYDEDADDLQILVEGEHEVTCAECDHEFEVSTAVRHRFKSPELMREEAK